MPEPAAWIMQLSTSRGRTFESSCGNSWCEYCEQYRAVRAAAATVRREEPPAGLSVASIMGPVWSVLARLTGGVQ